MTAHPQVVRGYVRWPKPTVTRDQFHDDMKLAVALERMGPELLQAWAVLMLQLMHEEMAEHENREAA